MTEQEWVEELLLQQEGILLDALLGQRSGGELAIWLKRMRDRMRTSFAAAYQKTKPVTGAVPQKVNGHEQPARTTQQQPNPALKR